MGLPIKGTSSLSTTAIEKTHIKTPTRAECEAKAPFPPQSGLSAGSARCLRFSGVDGTLQWRVSTNATWQLLAIPSASPGTVNIVVIIYF